VVYEVLVPGYDDDPRELWEIHEVTRYVRDWARLTGLDDPEHARRHLEPTSNLLELCGAFERSTGRVGIHERHFERLNGFEPNRDEVMTFAQLYDVSLGEAVLHAAGILPYRPMLN
jgi:hypothetical protein